eukprot:12797961-Prorocentrum_lima.AAC.1
MEMDVFVKCPEELYDVRRDKGTGEEGAPLSKARVIESAPCQGGAPATQGEEKGPPEGGGCQRGVPWKRS